MCLVHVKLELFTKLLKMGVPLLAFRVLKMRADVFSHGSLKNHAMGL